MRYRVIPAPIISMRNGRVISPMLEESMAAGTDDFIGKPFDGQDLTLRVRAMLRVKDLSNTGCHAGMAHSPQRLPIWPRNLNCV